MLRIRLSMTARGQMRPVSLVARSGQSWKVAVGIWTLVVGGFAVGIELLGPPEFRTAASVLVLVLAFLGFGVLWSVRCPKCRRSLGFAAFEKGRLMTWHEDLAFMTACPRCGYAGEYGRGGGA